MPEYDATNYPKPTTDDLTDGEVGRDPAGPTYSAWPSSNLLPDRYAGPPPAREFETSGGPLGRGTPVPAVKPPADAPAPLASAVPPPGHTAQP